MDPRSPLGDREFVVKPKPDSQCGDLADFDFAGTHGWMDSESDEETDGDGDVGILGSTVESISIE